MQRTIKYLQVSKAADAWPVNDGEVPEVDAELSSPKELLSIIQQTTSCTGVREVYLQGSRPDGTLRWQDVKNVSELPQGLLKVKVVGSSADNQDQLSAKIAELCSHVERAITDNSSQTIDASKVTIEEIEQIEAAMQAKRVLEDTTQLSDLQSDGLAYHWIENVDEDAPLQVSYVLPWLQEHLLHSPLQQQFEVININKKAAAAFPKASFAEMPRHYRGRADYLVLPQEYSHLEDASDQRKYALVVFEVKKEMSITALAQARLGFFTYGAYANAALLFVFTDLYKGGVLYWAQQVKEQQQSQLQVHQKTISGMQKLFGEVRMALQSVPADVMGGGTRSRSRRFLGGRLTAPERDTFSIAGLQHPQLLPGQLLSRAMAKLATSASDDREGELKAWFPHGDGEPVRFDTEDAPEHPAAATDAIRPPSWKSMFGLTPEEHMREEHQQVEHIVLQAARFLSGSMLPEWPSFSSSS